MTDAAAHRSGYVAVVGRPNVGKSTLLNALLGQKIAIVSPRPQTTRRRQLGILTAPEYQIIFVDTPGIHAPRHKLGEHMLAAATRALADADAILWLVDASEPPTDDDRRIAELLAASARRGPVTLALNKSDLLTPDRVLPHTQAFRALAPQAGWMLVSATRGDNREKLLDMIVAALPEGPRYFPEDEVTDAQVRDLAGELVREAALYHLRAEVPHGLAVAVDGFDESDPALTRIAATLFVERETHKGIVIGRGANMLKKIGAHARREIEALVGTKVYLELRVKVRPGWRKKESDLRELGYASE